MSHYLTFDIGTTALKSALISSEGRLLALHTSEYTLRAPHPDRAEMSPETYWRAAIEGARAVYVTAGAAPRALAAIGFSSQGQSFIPIDRAGRPLHDAIVWVDSRARPSPSGRPPGCRARESPDQRLCLIGQPDALRGVARRHAPRRTAPEFLACRIT